MIKPPWKGKSSHNMCEVNKIKCTSIKNNSMVSIDHKQKRPASHDPKQKLAATSYFHSYEAMVKSQDAEDIATISHLRPIFRKIKELGQSEISNHATFESGLYETSFTVDHDDTFQIHNKQDGSSAPILRSFNKVTSMRQTLDNPSSDIFMCDPREILTFSAIKSLATKLRRLNALNNRNRDTDASDLYFIQTDEQLMMILSKFEEAIDEWCKIEFNSAEELGKTGITFSEFVHVYKTVISGMKALQMLPSLPHCSEKDATATLASNNMEETVSYQREKTISRSLEMIKSFTLAPSLSASIISGSDDDSVKSFISQDVVEPLFNLIEPDLIQIGTERNHARNQLKKQGSQQKATWNFMTWSVFRLVIIVILIGGVIAFRMAMFPLTSFNSRLVSVEANAASDQIIELSLKNATISLQRSEGKLAMAERRIGTMTLQLEELKNKIEEKNNVISICDMQKVTNLCLVKLLALCHDNLDNCKEQRVTIRENQGLKNSECVDESDCGLDQPESNMEELVTIKGKQRKMLLTAIGRTQIFRALNVATITIRQGLSFFFKSITSKLGQLMNLLSPIYVTN